MMNLLGARNDAKFVAQFQADIDKLWELEAKASKNADLGLLILHNEIQEAIQTEAYDDPEYREVRARVAKGMARVIEIAEKNGVSQVMISHPAPAVGGPIINVNIFRCILWDTSHGGIKQQHIYDALMETLAASQKAARKFLLNALNPFYWLYRLLVFVIRIPFLLLSASGFSMAKIEDHLIARLFKSAEVIAILYIAVKLGTGKSEFWGSIIEAIVK